MTNLVTELSALPGYNAAMTKGPRDFRSWRRVSWRTAVQSIAGLSAACLALAVFSGVAELVTVANEPWKPTWILIVELSESKGAEEGLEYAEFSPVDATVLLNRAARRPRVNFGGPVDVSDDRTNPSDLPVCYFPPGEFEMGSPTEEAGRESSESLHLVVVARGFCLANWEVTQGRFESVLGRNPSHFTRLTAGRATENFPVEQVTWFDAAEFCNALSRQEGYAECYLLRNVKRSEGSITYADVTVRDVRGYRLPTEAEWEFACRMNTLGEPFHFGNALNGSQANVNGGMPYGTAIKGPALTGTCPVGSYTPSHWGLYDMHGNVSEWCHNQLPTAGSSAQRAVRGGGWDSLPQDARAARRRGFDPSYSSRSLGFRVLLPDVGDGR